MTSARQSLKRILTRQYVLLACVPLLLVILLSTAVVVPQTLRDIEADNQRTAWLVRSQVELLIAAPRDAATRAATHVHPGATELEIRAALSEALDEAQSLESVILLDTTGIVTVAEVRPGTRIGKQDWEGLDLSRRPFYEHARLATAPVWSNTFLSPLTGHITAVVCAPSDGRLVVADLSLDKMAHQMQLSGDVAVIVFDGLGRVIVHPDQARANWQENLSQVDLVHRALNGYVGPGEIELDGIRWLATVAPAATTGWYVLVAQPRNALFSPVKQLAGVIGIAILIVLGIVVAIALKLAQRQAGNYRQLVSAAADLVDDKPGEPDVDLGSEEVYALWAQLRRLLDRAKEQERSARHAQAELQALLDAATEVAIIAVDADHVVRLFNRGAEKMLGYRASEVLGQQCPLAVHDPVELAHRAEELSYQLKRPVNGREAITAIAERFGHEVRDWTYIRKDATRISVSLAVTAVRAALASAGTPQGPQDRPAVEGAVVFAPGSGVVQPASKSLGFLFVGTDQSERLRSGELELARRRAEAASQAKSEFLSRVSHELRTPMNAMLGYAQLLQLEEGHPLDGHQRERVARIEAAGWHLVTLINDVLDLSTIESGNARIQMADVDVGLVINESIRLLAPLAEAAKVTLAVALPQHLPREAWSVQADATRLRQVLVNVVGNAIKYNLENGRVDIQVHIRAATAVASEDAIENDPGRLVIEISDTGRGMTAAQLARLFSAFDRLGLEAGPIEGTGIGLVISRRLVERMGGDIAIDSRPDVGTRVTLTLRRAHGVPLLAAGDAPARVGSARGAGGQIVYVEDNPINALLMQEVVEQRPDCTLHLAVSVRDGIDMINRLHPDLVLVDLHLPDGSGLEVAEWMRTAPLLSRVPVVVVSADSTQAQRDAATVAGVRAYLAKPIRLTETLLLIDELLPATK
ncbi:MAG: ATP-binding protein [Burkholderiaceae bacterium]